LWINAGWDSAVSIATRYRLDGPGIESRWRQDFPHPPRPAPWAHPASYTMGTRSFPLVKRPGRGIDEPPPPSAKVTERVEPYLYSTSGSLWLVIGVNFTLLWFNERQMKNPHLEQIKSSM
jgi:hypothetical protein